MKILQQIKQRRLALGLKQSDMYIRTGISRQQYQKLEKQGNPSLSTLNLVAAGLNSELLLVPREKLAQVKSILASSNETSTQALNEDPWQGMLDDLK